MKVEIKAKVLHHDKLGTLARGQVVELPESQATEYQGRGWVQFYDTKVVEMSPEPKKRGRPPKAE